jgi:hypothetical protein
MRFPSPRSLRLEPLDDRCCPCACGLIGDTLFVTGDRAADRIAIDQSGDRAQVSCDDEPAQSFTGVFHVVVNTWAGDDSIVIDWEPGDGREPSPVRRTWDFDTGAGNDHVTATFTPGLDGLVFSNDLDNGDDTFEATFKPTESLTPVGDIFLGVQGGAGDEQIQLTLGGPDTGPDGNLFSSVTAAIDTDTGDDQVGVFIYGSEFLGPVDLLCATGAGDDRLTAAYKRAQFAGPLAVGIDTGAGADEVGIVTNWVPMELRPEGASDAALSIDLGSEADQLDLLVESEVTGPIPHLFGSLMTAIDAGAGDDQVNVTFRDILSDAKIRVDLGAGNDSFQGTIAIADLGGSVGPAPAQIDPGNFTVNLDVFGRAGNDMLGLQVGGPERHLLNSDLAVNFDGGAGADSCVIAASNTTVNGSVLVSAGGGAWSDACSVTFGGVTVAAGAKIDVAVSGGGGGDALSVGGIMPCYLPGSRGRITLAGDGGDDTIDASLLFPDPAGGDVGFVAIGGSGDDEIRADIMPCALPGGVVGVMIAGDEGNDAIGVTLRDAHVDGRFDLSVTGGAGADDLFVGGFCPCISPEAKCSILLAGDAGNDVIRGTLELDPDSQGLIDIVFQGGVGDDDLTLQIAGTSDPNFVTAKIDGGDGYDVAHATRGVSVVNCEEVFVID